MAGSACAVLALLVKCAPPQNIFPHEQRALAARPAPEGRATAARRPARAEAADREPKARPDVATAASAPGADACRAFRPCARARRAEEERDIVKQEGWRCGDSWYFNYEVTEISNAYE